jgi:hypothetical protein
MIKRDSWWQNVALTPALALALALASSAGNVNEYVVQSHSSVQSISLLRLNKVHEHIRECPSAYITNLRGIHAFHAVASIPLPILLCLLRWDYRISGSVNPTNAGA